MGPDVNGDYAWNVKNVVCAQPGENNLMKYGTGRYHAEVDHARGLFGHAPPQE